MFRKPFRKLISAIITLTVMMGIAAIGGAGVIQGSAASSASYVTIANVSRRYKDANTFFTRVNEYRKSKGLKEWTMDADTLEAAMVRATELALLLSNNSPDGNSGLQHITGAVRNQLIAHDVFSINNTLTEMKNNTTSNHILLGNDTSSAGVGVVVVAGTKYLVLYTSSKTPTKVSDSVLNQSSVSVDQTLRAVPSNFGDISIPYTNGQQLYCGSSVAANLKVKNKNLEGAYVLLTPENMTVKSSNESVMKRVGDRMVALAPGSATVSIYMNDHGYVGASCLFRSVSKKFSECIFSNVTNQYYTGQPICPAVTIKTASDEPLVEGTDYTITYSNNTAVGTATILITGKGAYTGESKQIDFGIVKKGGTDPVTPFSVSVSVPNSTISLGQSTPIIASTAGGEGAVKYTYSYADYGSTNWTVLASDVTSNTCTFTPTIAKKYYVRASATDSTNQTVVKTIPLTVVKAFSCTETLSADTVNLNKAVTVTAAGAYGTSPYTYAFYVVKPDSSAETLLRDYASGDSVSFTPTAEGTYQMIARCKDSTGAVASVTRNLTVVDGALKNKSTTKSSSVTLGQSIVMQGAASGGTAPYEFCYYYKRSSTTKWTLKKGFSSTTSVSFKPQAAMVYDICIKVKDSAGKTVKKYLEVTVKPKLVNNTTLSASRITFGQKVTVKCASSGGSGTKTYGIWCKRASATTWTKLRDYTAGTTYTMKPGHAEQYTIVVKVKDANERIVRKELKLDVSA